LIASRAMLFVSPESDIIEIMASIVIRRLDDQVKLKLRIRAAEHGRSMEEEAREILSNAIIQETPRERLSVAQSIRKDLADAGLKGFDLPLYNRAPMREPPDFSGPEFGTYDDEDEE